MSNLVPPIVPPLPAWQRTLSHVVEWTFYFLMILLPILGVCAIQAEGRTVSLLGWTLPTFVGVDKAWSEKVEDTHAWLGTIMLWLIGLHVAAAIYHLRPARQCFATHGRLRFVETVCAGQSRVQQTPAAECPVLPLRFLEHEHHVLGIEAG